MSLTACARRALAQREWREQSSFNPEFRQFVKERGITTSLEWFQAHGLKCAMASAITCDGVAVPSNMLLAYSAGLGKTLILVSIALVFGLRAVVVVPAVLLHQWRTEIVKHTVMTDTNIVTCRGAVASWPNITASTRFVLVSYASLSRAHASESRLPWSCESGWMAIFDEVHYIANKATLRYKSSMALVNSAMRIMPCITATGTPVKNGIGDLASVASVLGCGTVETFSDMCDAEWWKRAMDWKDVPANTLMMRWRQVYVITMGKEVLHRQLPMLMETVRVYEPFASELELTETLAINARRKCTGTLEHLILFDTFTRTNNLLSHPLAPRGHRVVRDTLERAGLIRPRVGKHRRVEVCSRCHGTKTSRRHVSRINEGVTSDDEDSRSNRRAPMKTCFRNHPVCSECMYSMVLQGCSLCAYDDALVKAGINLEPTTAEEIISISSKFREMRVVMQSIATDDSILIYGTSVATMLMLEVMVTATTPWREVIHLNYTVTDRDARIERWRITPRAVLISGIGVGGVGLTLVPQHDSGSGVWVLFSTVTINGSAMAQARDRAYRLGQRRTVTSVQFYPRGTIQSEDGWLAHNHRRINRECSEILPQLNGGECMRPVKIEDELSKSIVATMKELVMNRKRPGDVSGGNAARRPRFET